MTPRAPRCVLVEDHPALLQVVAALLADHEVEVCATASDGRRGVTAVREHKPDVVISDYRLPSLSGRDLIAAISEVAPDARIVVYTAEADPQLCAEALEAGAHGILLKSAPLADLARAVDAVLAGRTYVDPTLGSYGFLDAAPAAGLTQRESEVLSLLAEGMSHEQIAQRLEIGTETVRTHVRKATDRLGAATRTQAVATALRQGLIA